MFLLAAGRQFAVAPSAQAAATIWDGIYSDSQAKKGEMVYADFCAPCHGETPTGGPMAPGLAGDDFLADVVNTTIGDLADRIRQTMPANEPGKLNPQQVADVVAFIASANKWPAGTKDVPTDLAAQKQIRIVKK